MSVFLVTGGAGFIGSNLTERLLRDGHEVRILDNFSTGRRENLSFLDDHKGRWSLIEASIVDPEVCRETCRGAQYVLHHAALGSVPRSVEDPVGTHEAGATGTLQLLDAARRAEVKRFVYAASSSAYGDTPVMPKEESMRVSPLSPYAATKLAGEHYCTAFTSSCGLETVSLRYFNVFGRRQDPDSAYAAVIPRFVKAILKDERAVIYGDGEQTRDFTHIDDVIEANLLACRAPSSACGEVYNIAGGERVSINELYRLIAGLLDSETQPIHEAPRAGDVRHSLADLTKAGKGLGFNPRHTVRTGLGQATKEKRKQHKRHRSEIKGNRRRGKGGDLF